MPGPSVPVPVKKGQGEAVGRAVAFTPYFSGGGNARCLILKKGPPQSVRQSGLSPDSSPVPVYLPPIPPLSFILLQRWADRVNTVPISSLVVGPPLSRAIKDDSQKSHSQGAKSRVFKITIVEGQKKEAQERAISNVKFAHNGAFPTQEVEMNLWVYVKVLQVLL